MDRPVRVLHVYRTYFPDTQGGLEEAIRQICYSTREHAEHRIFTLSKNPVPDVIEFPEAVVYRAPLDAELQSCSISFRALRQFRELVEWADVLHYQFPWPFADVLHLLGGAGKPAMVTYQSDIVRQQWLMKGYQLLMKRFLSGMDAIIATSENYLNSSPVLASLENRVRVIPNCLIESTQVYARADEVSEMRRRVGENFMLFVGVLRYYKGLSILLDALEGTTIRCVIAGTGPMQESVRRLASKNANVILTGYVDDVEKSALFQLCRGVVLPSHLRSEAFGITLLEGAMCSKPLICTELNTGTSFVNLHGETGLVVRPGCAASLREAMLKLIEDGELAAKLGRRARRRYEQHFSGALTAHSYARLYKAMAVGYDLSLAPDGVPLVSPTSGAD